MIDLVKPAPNDYGTIRRARFKAWLAGTRCHNKRREVYYISDCKRFVIFKHYGHSIGTKGGKITGCRVTYHLMDLDSAGPFNGPAYGALLIKKGALLTDDWNDIREIIKRGQL